MEKFISTKVWERTLSNVRLIYGMTGESMVSIIDRLVSRELREIQTALNHEKEKVKADST